MAQATKVEGRRRLHFETHEETLAEVRRLASGPVRQLGNWSLPAICQHLATAMDLCIDGEIGFPVPWTTRLVARLARRRILKTGLPRGFQLPEQATTVLYPKPESMEAALAALERGIARLKTTDDRMPHPVLGKMNAAQWDQFHLRHAELHLGFIVAE